MFSPPRIVFDCNVFFQAAISAAGPAHRLLQHVVDGHATLFISTFVIGELTELTADPRIKNKYRLTDGGLAEYFATIRRHAVFVDNVPHVFDFDRDPDDAHYVDLAVAANARLIVSRDKDLLSLRDITTADGQQFLARFPTLSILTPPEALKVLDGESPS
jgi:putative PIN family toxin of toxin-antitoxin system